MIELKNISKWFSVKSDKVSALQNVSLSVAKGEIFGVIGKSGAGKSTLVRCVNLLERPDSGEVLINQQNLLNLSPVELRRARHQIGMIFQHFNLLNSRTVYENIALPLELVRRSKTEIKASVGSLIDFVGLADRASAYPNQLSGGQKQRVAIARALSTKPQVLLCDEMTSALDPETTQSILDLIRDINAEMGLTILMITHEMEVIKRICDKVAVLDNGAVVEQGEVAQVFRKPVHPISKSLTQSAFHMALPETLQEKVMATASPGSYHILRISFVGDSAVAPIISDLVRHYELSVNILQSNLEMLHTKPIGMMLVAVQAEQSVIDSAIAYMHKENLTVEVVGYVAANDWHIN